MIKKTIATIINISRWKDNFISLEKIIKWLRIMIRWLCIIRINWTFPTKEYRDRLEQVPAPWILQKRFFNLYFHLFFLFLFVLVKNYCNNCQCIESFKNIFVKVFFFLKRCKCQIYCPWQRKKKTFWSKKTKHWDDDWWLMLCVGPSKRTNVTPSLRRASPKRR